MSSAMAGFSAAASRVSLYALVLASCLPTCILPVLSLGVGNPYSHLVARRSTKPLEVDLGYATYRGEYNEKTGLNTWLG